MRKLAKKLLSEKSGSPAVEFALAAPVFIALLIGIFQLGIFYLAQAGLHQSVEIGARYATLYPRPTDAQISAKVRGSGYGMDLAKMSNPIIVHGSNDGAPYIDITVSYTLQPNFIFFEMAPFQLTRTRRAYQV